MYVVEFKIYETETGRKTESSLADALSIFSRDVFSTDFGWKMHQHLYYTFAMVFFRILLF